MANNDETQNPPHDRGDHDENPDPITGAPGSHLAGTGIGAASGAATGAALGALGGPAGAAIGGVSGAIVGGFIGHGIGEAVDPTEDDYWRNAYVDRPYTSDDRPYEAYEPAYRLGYNAYDARGADYGPELEADLQRTYVERHGDGALEWEQARPAVRDAYERRARRRAEAST